MRRSSDPVRQMQLLADRMREVMAIERRRRTARPPHWQPPIDLTATDEQYVITLDLPGASQDQIEATAEDGVVRIRGEVTLPEQFAEGRRVRDERTLGRFARSIRLPSDADTSSTSARLSDGVLTITVGRRTKTGRIAIDIEE